MPYGQNKTHDQKKKKPVAQPAATTGGGVGQTARKQVGITPGQYTPVMENHRLNMHGTKAASGPTVPPTETYDPLAKAINPVLGAINKGARNLLGAVTPPLPAHHTSPAAKAQDAWGDGGRGQSGGMWGTPFIQPGPQELPPKPALPEGQGLGTNPQVERLNREQKRLEALQAAGITRTPDQETGRTTYTMGERGGPFAQATVSDDFKKQMQARASQQARQQLAGPRSQYSFEGSADDAAKFFAPVSRPAPTAATLAGGDVGPVRSVRGSRGKTQVPDDLDPRSGWGWNARQRNFAMANNIDQHNDRMGLDAAKMSLDAQKAGADNQIAREKLAGEQQSRQLENQQQQFNMGRQQQIAAAQDILASAPKDSPEYSQAMQQLRGLNASGQGEQPKIHTSKIYDQFGSVTGEAFNRYNPETGVMERVPVSGQATQAPPDAIEYLMKNDTPENKKYFMETFGYLPPGV